MNQTYITDWQLFKIPLLVIDWLHANADMDNMSFVIHCLAGGEGAFLPHVLYVTLS